MIHTYNFSNFVKGIVFTFQRKLHTEEIDCYIYEGLRFDFCYSPLTYSAKGIQPKIFQTFSGKYVQGYKIDCFFKFTIYSKFFDNKK